MPNTPLDTHRYVNLETFKKDGNGVKTPVWAAPTGGRLVIMTGADSFKVKRLRRNPKIRIAGCNGNGKQILTPWYEGEGRVLEAPADVARADAALKQKYGLVYSGFNFFAKLFGYVKERCYLEISLQAN